MSFVGRHISSLPTPALIVDKEKVIHVNFLFPSPSFTLDRMWSFCPSLRQTAKRCSIWRQQTRSRWELRPKPTRRWRGAFCRCDTIINCPFQKSLHRRGAQEGRLSPRPWWRPRCTRTPGSRTSSTDSRTSPRIRIAPGSSGRGWRSSIWWFEGSWKNIVLTGCWWNIYSAPSRSELWFFLKYNNNICIVHCVLCIVHCSLYIVYCTLCRWPTWRLPRIWRAVLHQRARHGRCSSRWLIFQGFWTKIYLSAKVDCGNKRAGVRSDDAEAVNIVAFIHKHPRQV